jgi:hypothetical protein
LKGGQAETIFDNIEGLCEAFPPTTDFAMLRSASKKDLRKFLEEWGVTMTETQWSHTKKVDLMKMAIKKKLEQVESEGRSDIPDFKTLWRTLADLLKVLRTGVEVSISCTKINIKETLLILYLFSGLRQIYARNSRYVGKSHSSSSRAMD